jgi:predicted Zn-dependent protease with MMP-like domain
MTSVELTRIAVDVVTETQRKLPREIRDLAASVPVHYEPVPSDDVIEDGFPDDILGLFTGSPHGQEADATTPELPQILLYVENVWEFTEGDVDAYREEVQLTYLHELGHYFGWDEDQLTARGLE